MRSLTRQLAALAAALAFLLVAPVASASKGTVAIWGSKGSAAGQLRSPKALGVNQSTGDVYIADGANNRVLVFDPAGNTERVFGWGVVAAGPNNDPQNEQQVVSVDATGGTFTLRFLQSGERSGHSAVSTTAAIAYDASAAEVQSALESSVGQVPPSALEAGDVSVSGPVAGPWTIEFTGYWADADVAQLIGNATNLTGGAESVGATTAVQGGNYEVCVPADGDSCRLGQRRGSSPGQLAAPTGLAIDQSNGSLYVGDVGNARVQKFDPEGNFVLAFGDGVNQTTGGDVCTAASGNVCQAGTRGSANGQFPQTDVSTLNVSLRLAVDPTTGRVYLADTGLTDGSTGFAEYGNRRVQVFSSSGQFASAFALPQGDAFPPSQNQLESGQFTHYSSREPLDLAAAASSRIYTTQAGDSFGWEGGNQVRVLSSAGASLGDFAPDFLPTFPAAEPNTTGTNRRGVNPTYVAVNPTDEHVLVTRLDRPVPEGGDISDPTLRWEVAEFDSAGNLLEEHAIGMPNPNGVAVDATSGRIYITTEDSQVYVFDEVPDPPIPSLGATTAITASAATLNGTVNPNGGGLLGTSTTAYRFEYRAEGTETWTLAPVPDVDVGLGTSPVPVSQPISGLDPNTKYQIRLVATRSQAGGSATSAQASFTTQALPPVVAARSAYPVVDTTATLRGTIDPKNSATTYYFEYGLDTSYGTKVPMSGEGAAGDELGTMPVYEEIEGLLPETTYHYRLVAENQAGTAEVEDQTITTISSAAAEWPARGIELVNSPDKANQSAFPGGFADRLGDDAELWTTQYGPAPGSTVGNGSFFLATRTAAGWHSESLTPPTEKLLGGGSYDYQLQALSADGSRAVFTTYAGEEPRHVVLWDRDIGEQIDLLQIANIPTIVANNDLSRIFVGTDEPLVGGHVVGTQNIYLAGDGTPEIVNRLPNNAVPACGIRTLVFGVGTTRFGGSNEDDDWISTIPSKDGSILFFESKGNSCSGPFNLFRRDLESESTMLISGPPTAGLTGESWFIKASGDGDSVVFSTLTRLDSDDTNNGRDIYQWTVGNGHECLTCIVPNADTHADALVSKGLDYIYFTSKRQLVPGEGDDLTGTTPSDPSNLYVVHDGELRYISPYKAGNSQGELEPNGAFTHLAIGGRQLFYLSRLRVTPDIQGVDPSTGNPADQWFRYDYADGGIECIACPRPGIGPQVDARTGNLTVSADGQTAVFNTEVPLVERDVNRRSDTYEWHEGRFRLITNGIAEYPQGGGSPKISHISSSGLNVFFTVAGQLTGYEQDETQQVYVARVGGGFPPPPTPPASCIEDSCQGPLEAPPRLDGVGSATFSGLGNQITKRKRSRIRRKCRHRRKGKVLRKCKHARKGARR